jgi:hypothetical protein
MQKRGTEIVARRERPRKHAGMTEEEGLQWQREQNRLRKRRYRASKSEEDTAKEKERNRMYMRKLRASLTSEEIERRQEEDRLLKRRTRETVRQQKLSTDCEDGNDIVWEMLDHTDFWNYAALVNGKWKEQSRLIKHTQAPHTQDRLHEIKEKCVK